MRRTDRLFELIQILRDGRLHTARDMADRLEDRTAELGRLSDDHAPVIQFSGADEIVRPQHPRNLRVLPGSRDFH